MSGGGEGHAPVIALQKIEFGAGGARARRDRGSGIVVGNGHHQRELAPSVLHAEGHLHHELEVTLHLTIEQRGGEGAPHGRRRGLP
jgi:hypothetical protein